MDFSLQEISNRFGKPAFLVSFERGGKTWTYTSATRDVTLADRIYQAVPLKVGVINQSGDTQADEVTIEMPADSAMVSTHIQVPPTERVFVKIARYHKDGDNATLRFVGQVDRVKRVSPIRAEVKCKTYLATYARTGARLAWQRGCTHALYDPGCTVPRADYGVPGVVTEMDSAAIMSPGLAALADGRFRGGFIEWDFEPAITARRMISEHTGEWASLLGGTYGVSLGTTFTAYPGCPRTAEACLNFYNNLPNYGGCDHLPSKSPFNGESVF